MAATYKLISAVTVGAGGAASIDFSSIPSTYTDLLLKISGRSNTSAIDDNLYIKFNNSSTSFTFRYLQGNGSSAYSATASLNYIGTISAASATSSTFGNAEIYLPNYAGSNNKSISNDTVAENNASSSSATLTATLWSNTAAINQVTVLPASGSFVQYSTAYLYGIKSS